MCVWICVHGCICMYMEVRGWHRLSSSILPRLIFETGSQPWTSSSFKLGRLTNKLQESSCPHRHQCWGYKHAPSSPAFIWVLETWTWALTLVQQAPQPLSHLPSPPNSTNLDQLFMQQYKTYIQVSSLRTCSPGDSLTSYSQEQSSLPLGEHHLNQAVLRHGFTLSLRLRTQTSWDTRGGCENRFKNNFAGSHFEI